jgi:hypothetical protein
MQKVLKKHYLYPCYYDLRSPYRRPVQKVL